MLKQYIIDYINLINIVENYINNKTIKSVMQSLHLYNHKKCELQYILKLLLYYIICQL